MKGSYLTAMERIIWQCWAKTFRWRLVSCPTRLSPQEQRNVAQRCARWKQKWCSLLIQGLSENSCSEIFQFVPPGCQKDTSSFRSCTRTFGYKTWKVKTPVKGSEKNNAVITFSLSWDSYCRQTSKRAREILELWTLGFLVFPPVSEILTSFVWTLSIIFDNLISL